jgi:plasmid maintenance system antidote protein VapI
MQTKQLLKPQLAQAKKIESVDLLLVRQARNATDAAKQQAIFSDATYEAIANGMGRGKETVTRFVNGNGGFNPEQIEKFILECGNTFFLQYLAYQAGYELKAIDQREARKAELLAELQQLENAA